MDNRRRENIINNMDYLIDNTNYEKLKISCAQNGLFSKKMCDIIEDIDPLVKAALNNDDLQREKHRRLLMKITKRGPDAYNVFKNICIKLSFDEAVQCLNQVRLGAQPFHETPPTPRQPLVNVIENAQEQSRSSDTPDALHEFTGQIEPIKRYIVEPSNMLHHGEYNRMEVYPMKTKYDRGVLLIVNIIEYKNGENYRNGAPEDSKSLLHLFKQFNFRLYNYENLTKEKFFQILNKLLKSDVVKRTECFQMVLMTHGTLDSYNNEWVEFFDNEIVKVNDIIRMFYNENCPNLIGKPKILIFPFCRGDSTDTGLKVIQPPPVKAPIENDSAKEGPPNNIPINSDLLIVYAAQTGYKTFRDPNTGSWYIQELCEIMARNAHNLDVEGMIKLTNAKVQKMRTDHNEMQLPNYHNRGFNKLLFYNPGQYENET